MSRISRKDRLRQARKANKAKMRLKLSDKDTKKDDRNIKSTINNDTNDNIDVEKAKNDFMKDIDDGSDFENTFRDIFGTGGKTNGSAKSKNIFDDDMKTADRIVSVEDEKTYLGRKNAKSKIAQESLKDMMTVDDIVPAEINKASNHTMNSNNKSIKDIESNNVDDINRIKKINLEPAPFEDVVKVVESRKMAEKEIEKVVKREEVVADNKNTNISANTGGKETLAQKIQRELEEKEKMNSSASNEEKPMGLKSKLANKEESKNDKSDLGIVAKEDLENKDKKLLKKEENKDDSMEKTRVVKKTIGAGIAAKAVKDVSESKTPKSQEKPANNAKPKETESSSNTSEVDNKKVADDKTVAKNQADTSEANYSEAKNKEVKKEETADKEKSIKKDKEKADKPKSSKLKKVLLGILGAIVFVYLAGCLVFTFIFLPNTKVNGMDVSFRTPSKLDQMAKARTQNYEIKIQGRNNVNDSIKGSDIDLKYVSDGSAQKIKDSQNPFIWPVALFEKEEINGKLNLKYDKAKLAKKVAALNVLNKKNFKEPISAHPKYDEKKSKLVVDPGFDGSVALPNRVKAFVDESIQAQALEAKVPDKAYKPKKNKENDPRIKKSISQIEKYTDMKVVYDFGYEKYTVGGTDILSMFNIDIENDYKTEFSKDKVREVVRKLSRKYSTYGNTREINSISAGKKIKVEGGDYGWLIDRESETDELYKIIKAGKSVENRKPIYAQTAPVQAKDDIGDEFIEIDLTKQHMWYVKKGKAIVSTPIVSGNPNTGAATPTGIYSLDYKVRNAVLRGPGYASPVSYWMPFNESIGIHDSYWQAAYGGERYQYAGSHGCINTPYDAVAKIFGLSTEKMAVIVHD